MRAAAAHASRGRRRKERRVYRTHQTAGKPVGTLDDDVAGTPEGIVGEHTEVWGTPVWPATTLTNPNARRLETPRILMLS